jgi:hypothetical protein
MFFLFSKKKFKKFQKSLEDPHKHSIYLKNHASDPPKTKSPLDFLRARDDDKGMRAVTR